MKAINMIIINEWFDSLSFDQQTKLCMKHLEHYNVDMLNYQDIAIIYIKEKGVN